MPTLEDAALARLEKIYKDKISFYQDKLRAINVLKDVNDESPLNNSGKSVSANIKFEVPEKYDAGFSQDFKAYFALRNIKEGFTEDVAKELVRLDSKITPDRANMIAIQKLSQLKRKGYINHTLVGRKFKYWI